ncbi:MAG: Ig-like domain-containing protein [Acidimicrobiales bacterium]
MLLNVASPGMGCDTASLTAAQKADLVSFASGGKKLVIYDSECDTGDYSWLPFPFTTSNPGAAGATGTFTIVENNTLASADPADSHYIDAALLQSGTDAVGDANVFTTFDPNWCVADSATNTLGVNGPVHTYARVGPAATGGLLIYNGLDVDDMDTFTDPESSTASGNLAKLWLQELQQPTSALGLPCEVSAVGISLLPASAVNPLGASHTVTAHVTDPVGQPRPGTTVTFTVLSGPNAAASGTCTPNADCTTDANGDANFTYVGAGGEGTDSIQACFTEGATQVCSVVVSKIWSSSATTTTSSTTSTSTTSSTTSTSTTSSTTTTTSTSTTIPPTTSTSTTSTTTPVTTSTVDPGSPTGGPGAGSGTVFGSALARTGAVLGPLAPFGFLALSLGSLLLLGTEAVEAWPGRRVPFQQRRVPFQMRRSLLRRRLRGVHHRRRPDLP